MIKGIVITVAGFAIGTAAGFAFGKAARQNTPSNVAAGYSSGVVTITADVKNIASQSITDAKNSLLSSLGF